jgi:hypothetical protein
MAKVKHPLFSGDVSGAFGKKMIFKKGGIVTRMFWPRNPRTAAQQRQRELFKEFSVPSLTQEQADLLYASILHQHDDFYSLLGHGHDHGDLSGLADDDHTQYYNQTRGDARYSLLAHVHAVRLGYQSFYGHGLTGTVVAAGAGYLPLGYWGISTIAYTIPLLRGGTLKNLRYRHITNQPASGSMTVTVMKNNVATLLKITLTSAISTPSFQTNLIDTVAVSAGDTVVVELKNNATSASGQVGYVSFELEYATG